jgi:rubrerythrin
MTTLPFELVQQTLLRAIQIEKRNGNLYDSLAQIFEGYDEPVRVIFSEMAAEERAHGAELEKHYRSRFGSVPLLPGDPKDLIETPDLEDAEALVFDSMTPQAALQVGLHAEEAAREFYLKELSRTSDPELRQVYWELGEFEETHVRVLQQKLAERGQSANLRSR